MLDLISGIIESVLRVKDVPIMNPLKLQLIYNRRRVQFLHQNRCFHYCWMKLLLSESQVWWTRPLPVRWNVFSLSVVWKWFVGGSWTRGPVCPPVACSRRCIQAHRAAVRRRQPVQHVRPGAGVGVGLLGHQHLKQCADLGQKSSAQWAVLLWSLSWSEDEKFFLRKEGNMVNNKSRMMSHQRWRKRRRSWGPPGAGSQFQRMEVHQEQTRCHGNLLWGGRRAGPSRRGRCPRKRRLQTNRRTFTNSDGAQLWRWFQSRNQ